MGTRIRISLRVLLPGLVVSIVALGAVAAGAVAISGTRGYLVGQADDNLLACAGEMLSQGFVAGPTSGPAPSGACDVELLSASGQLLTPPAPGAGPGPAIPANRSWLAAHTARPVTAAGASAGSWRVLLEAVHYQSQRILFVYGTEDVEYVISGPAGRGPVGLLVVTAGLAGVDRLTERVAASYAAAAGAVLVLLAVAGLAVTRAVLRPLQAAEGQAAEGQAARPGPGRDRSGRDRSARDRSARGRRSQWSFAPALTRVSEQMSASRAAEAAARRSAAEMSGRLGEVSLELRTSVSIVRGFAEYYRQRAEPLSAACDPMMRRAADEVTRIETLVARLDVSPPSHTPPSQTNAADPQADAERDVP